MRSALTVGLLVAYACALAQSPSQTLLTRDTQSCGLYGWIKYDGARIEATAVAPCAISLPLPATGDQLYLLNASARVLRADRRFFADSFGD